MEASLSELALEGVNIWECSELVGGAGGIKRLEIQVICTETL